MPVGEPMGDEPSGPPCPQCGRVLPKPGARCPWCGSAPATPGAVRTLTGSSVVDGLIGVFAAAAPFALAIALLFPEWVRWSAYVPLVAAVLWAPGVVVVVRRKDLRTFRRAFAITVTVLLTPVISAMGLLSLCAVMDMRAILYLPAALALLAFVFWLMRAATRDGSR